MEEFQEKQELTNTLKFVLKIVLNGLSVLFTPLYRFRKPHNEV